MEKRTKRVKLSDIARAARVSTATVSRFVGARGGITPGTRDRIIAAADRLGFDLERGRKSRIIVFLLSNRSVLHPFHSAVLMGAQAYCGERDYAMLFLPFHYSTTEGTEDIALPEILLQRKIVAGVIVAGTNSNTLLRLLTQKGIPWVALGNNLIQRESADLSGGGAIYFDDISGAHEVTQYLLSLGHREIAFIGNLSLPWFVRRYEGYARAMREAGLKIRLNDRTFREGEDMGYLTTKLILQLPDVPTAIFAGDDTACRGVYQAARDRGLRIPEDLSVVGFNDTPEASALNPPLTSVHVFTDELGKQMAEALLERIANPNAQPVTVQLPTRLIRRESCAPPSGASNGQNRALLVGTPAE